MPAEVICACGSSAQLVTGAVIYPHRPDLAHLNFYQCASCDARVGTRPGTTVPLGNLANSELRSARMRAHQQFDPIWKQGTMSRTDAYAWLAQQMQLPTAQAHIGQFDLAQCHAVCNLVAQFHKIS